MHKVTMPSGELFDRLSIMKLKKQKRQTNDFDSLIKEYSEAANEMSSTEVTAAFGKLTKINSQLWELEDIIRSDIDSSQFYTTAKRIFHLNEIRAEVKAVIDKETKGVVDVKLYSNPT